MPRTLRMIAVLTGWTITSAATAALAVYLEHAIGFSLYRFMFWFVIPAGAILSGMLAATGYSLTARLVHFRPRGSVFPLALINALVTYLFMVWLEYSSISVKGLPISHWISFQAYLQYSLTHAHMIALGFGDASIGFAGAILAPIQVLGFSTGATGMAAALMKKSWCEDCSLYLKGTFNQVRYFDWHDDLKKTGVVVLEKFRAGSVKESIKAHAANGSPRKQKSSDYSSTFHMQQCRKCNNGEITFISREKDEAKWTPVPDLSHAVKFRGENPAL